jgi:sulfite exporter TauE/SafE
MKTVLRIVAILASALLVVAGLLVFRGTAPAQALASARPERDHFSQEHSAPPAMATRPRRGQALFDTRSGLAGHGPENHGPSLFGAVEMLKNLAIIAVGIVLIVLGTWLVQRARCGRPRSTPPELRQGSG